MPRTREQHYPSKLINYSYSKKIIRRCMTNILCSLKLINCALNIDLKLTFSLFFSFFERPFFTRMTVEGREESRGSLIESLLLFFTIVSVTAFASNVH